MEMMKKKMGLKEYAKYEKEEYARKPAGEAMRPAIISDAAYPLDSRWLCRRLGFLWF
jgi:diphthamide synthase (EF-2-diphthine--ammonia ligase)